MHYAHLPEDGHGSWKLLGLSRLPNMTTMCIKFMMVLWMLHAKHIHICDISKFLFFVFVMWNLTMERKCLWKGANYSKAFGMTSYGLLWLMSLGPKQGFNLFLTSLALARVKIVTRILCKNRESCEELRALPTTPPFTKH